MMVDSGAASLAVFSLENWINGIELYCILRPETALEKLNITSHRMWSLPQLFGRFGFLTIQVMN